MDALHLVVRGHVQGVGFRWFVRESARAAGLAGWVRNNPDGSVELMASGPAAALSALHEAVRVGPTGARVTAVDELRSVPEALPHPFTVHR